MKRRTVTAFLLILAIMLCSIPGLAEPPVQTEGITVPVIEDMKEYKIPETEALALMRDMKCGWNL